MRYVIALTLLALTFSANGQDFYNKVLRRATFYAAANGGNSISDQNIYSLSSGSLATDVVETPFDYSLTLGIRKIARFGYENRANVFYDGTEHTYGDAATVGKRNGFEFLAEAVKELGFENHPVMLKDDQEPAIKAVADAFCKNRHAQTLLEESPVGSSGSVARSFPGNSGFSGNSTGVASSDATSE